MGLERLHHEHQRGVHALLAARVFQIIIASGHAPGNDLQLCGIFPQLPFDGQRDARRYCNAEKYAHQRQGGPDNARLAGNILRLCRRSLAALYIVLHQLVKIAGKADKISPAAGEQGNGCVCFTLTRKANDFLASFILCLQLGHDIGPQLSIDWLTSVFTRLNQGLVNLCVLGKLLEGALDAVAVFGNGHPVGVGGKGRKV